MSTQLPTLKGRIEIDSSALDGVERRTKSFGSSMIGAGKLLTAGLTVPIIGAGVAGVKMAMDVDKGLREVNTLFGLTGKAGEQNFKFIQAGVKDLSNELGVAQDVLTKGLYQAISAGIPKDNAFEFMQVAAKAAIAGVTDTETAVDGLTTTLNAFGLDASQAQAVADSMFTAVKGGKTTFEELASSLFQVAPAAAAAGVKFTDVNAALAALTASGTPTSVATTQMRAAIVELTKSGTKASDAFREASGKTFPEFISSGGNLQEALQVMSAAADKSGVSVLDMFGSVEAGQAALSLTGTASDKFSEQMRTQADATGAVQTAFDEMNKSGARQFETAMVRLKNALIDLGNILLPIITSIITKVGEWATKFSELSPAVQKVILVIAGLVAAVGPLLIIAGTLINSFKTIKTAMMGVNLVMSVNPFVLLGVAIAALAYLIYTHWDEIKAATTAAWNAIKNAVGAAWDWIKANVGTAIRVLLAILTGGLSEAVRWVVTNWDKIKAATSAAWNAIKSLLSTAWNAIKSAVSSAASSVRDAVVNAWNTIKAATTAAWNAVKSMLSTAWNAIKSAVSNAASSVRDAVVNAWNTIKDRVTGAMGSMSSALSNAWNTIKSTVSNAVAQVKGAVVNGFNAVVSFVAGIPGRIRGALGSLGGLLTGAGRALMDGLLNGIRAAWNAVASYLSGLAAKIRNLKGPIEKDRKLLIPQGSAIIEGFEAGLRKRWGGVENFLAHATDGISLGAVGVPAMTPARPLGQAGFSTPTSSGNTYNLHVNGTWDLSDPTTAWRFGERVISIIRNVEMGKL